MQKVACALIHDVQGARRSLPDGFVRRDPASISHLSLIMLAELLRDVSRPENRADSDEVVSDIRLILKSEAQVHRMDLIMENSLCPSRFIRTQQTGRGKFLP